MLPHGTEIFVSLGSADDVSVWTEALQGLYLSFQNGSKMLGAADWLSGCGGRV